MDVWGLASAAGAWSATAVALGATSFVAALVVRSHLRLEQQAARLDAEVEGLQDRIWRLADSEERYRGLVEAQLDIIVQRDAAGAITFANEGFARLAGQGRESLIGSTGSLPALESRSAHLRADGVKLWDEAFPMPGGTRWIAWIETTIAGRDGAPETLRAGRDVTERVAAERALEEARSRAEAASEAKSRFLATVSHEFRTPLNGILGMADLVLDTPLDPEQTTYVAAVKTSGEALLSLIDEILDFSKIEAGRIDLSTEPFDLHALVEGVVELLAPRAQGKGIEIAAFVAPGVPRRVIGDGDRLRQVLVNLAGNAVKFTDAGGVGVTVEQGGPGEISIVVSDTGPGIAPDRVPALFQEFEQGDGSASRRHGGTGLGLAITRRIVERMQGAIEVGSEPGHGAAFHVRLPLPQAQGAQIQGAQIQGTPAQGGGVGDPSSLLAGQRFVICARSPYEAPFLARRLRQAGALAELVETADEAAAAMTAGRCDGLIADRALGDETVRRLAKTARDIGVGASLVLLSPFDRRDFGAPSASGFDAYLVKPVRARSLFERLTALPLAKPARRQKRPAQPRRKGEGPPPRVLLAEDNEINALLAIRSLEKLGALVDWARDGEEALGLAHASLSEAREPFDLVLMDIRMPGLDGHEATRRIRKLEAALGRPTRLRIIALTANALKEDEAAADGAGFDGFLAKPFTFEALAGLLAPATPGLAQAS